MELTPQVEVSLVRYDGRLGEARSLSDVVVREVVVSLLLSGEHVATFASTPGMLKEQVLGFLFSEGIIRGLGDVKGLRVEGHQVHVDLGEEAKFRAKLRGRDVVVGSACGGYMRGFKVSLIDELALKPVTSKLSVKASAIIEAAGRLNEHCKVYRSTGGTHAVALFNAEAEPLVVAEDVSRHNAFDKAVGTALIKGLGLDGLFASCTGRLSLELVLKAVRCGLPIVSSISAPTDLGVEVAKRFNLTLIGFVRGRRFNVYSHPWRVVV
jgi:FdhD protein